MIQRHQDYQISFPTVPVGGVFNVPLKLDHDAPFALRLVKSRNMPTVGSGWRFKTPRGLFQSPEFRNDFVSDGAGNLRTGQGSIIYPQMEYPIGSTIDVDIQNTTGAPLTNVRLLFRGSKLFQDGAYRVPTYPPKLSMLPFIYQVPVLQVPISGNSNAVPGLSTVGVLNNILNIRSDSDFALRYLCADPFAMAIDGGVNPPPQGFQEVYVRLYDESRKYFSNEPIHIADLFTVGAGLETSDFPTTFFPGLLTPEIYLTKEGTLYFDVFRDDRGFPNQFPVDIYFRFMGAKVFNR